MRAFVMVEPKFFTPPEIFPTLLEGFAAWREANREHMESFEFFAGGGRLRHVPDVGKHTRRRYRPWWRIKILGCE